MEGLSHYVQLISTENTGGGCMVDFIHLKSGEVVAISDEAVVIYKSYSDWERELEGEVVPNLINWLAKLGR